MRNILLALIFLFTVHSSFAADARPEPPMIRVTGEAKITATPDTADVNIGVVTQSTTAKSAAEQNAEKSDRVVKAVRRLLGDSGEIKTVNYALNPVYTYPREGGDGKITGYTASNIVQVTTGDLTLVGKIVDAATQNGANRIESLSFYLKNDTEVRIQALTLAAKKAKSKAEALASALGVRIARIQLIEEGGQGPIPLMERRMVASMETAQAQTVIEPGSLEIAGTVTLSVVIEK